MHAQGHVREAFLNAVTAREADDLAREEIIARDRAGRPLTWGRVRGLLWNCTDVVPGPYCDDLGAPRGSTYAQVVRGLPA